MQRTLETTVTKGAVFKDKNTEARKAMTSLRRKVDLR